jgi:deoxyribodipyrimidine photo-lyase
MTSIAIVWYRRDLRVHDHPGLAEAAREFDQVVPVFVTDPRFANGRYASERRTGYMRSALHVLDTQLQELGSKLHFREGDPTTVIPQLAEETNAQAVFFSTDVSRYALTRDQDVVDALGARARPTNGNYIVDLDRIATQNGDPYSVFSPFYRTQQQFPRRAIHRTPQSLSTPTTLTKGRLEPGTHDDTAGELHAREVAKRFLDRAASDYADEHDTLAGGTSGLSPHLRWGTISPLALEHRARNAGADAFVRQLAWRDFYAHVLLHEIGSKRPDPQWDDDPGHAHLKAWQTGHTGYPIVDAGMRQLAATGWMHNRARLVVGSFLTKDLHLDWRLGEVHFARELLDGELAQNNGNWRWIASVGVDPAPPARRMFNPTLQQRKFDPDGVYVRRWVPELTNVPDDKLAEPWTMSDHEQQQAGCVIGRDYPAPIVDHHHERKRALSLYAR